MMEYVEFDFAPFELQKALYDLKRLVMSLKYVCEISWEAWSFCMGLKLHIEIWNQVIF